MNRHPIARLMLEDRAEQFFAGERDCIESEYRQKHFITSMPPPSKRKGNFEARLQARFAEKRRAKC